MGGAVSGIGSAASNTTKGIESGDPKTIAGTLAGGLLGPVGMAYGSKIGSLGSSVLGGAQSSTNAPQINVGPQPVLADRSSMLQNGQLTGGAYLNPSQYQGNTSALDALNQKATQQGPSPWLQMQLAQQNNATMQNLGHAASQANAGNASARANLAMKGGLSGGAAERVARGGANDLNAQRQNITAAGETNKMNLGIQDQSNQNQLLGQAVSANANQNAQNIGIGQFNAQNTLAENNANNAFNMSKYQQQMQAYGAGNTANAIASGGKK